MPQFQIVRADEEQPPVIVGGVCVNNIDTPTTTASSKKDRGQRGNDKTQRKGRSCKRCLKSNGEHAYTCKGRGGESKCEYFRN